MNIIWVVLGTVIIMIASGIMDRLIAHFSPNRLGNFRIIILGVLVIVLVFVGTGALNRGDKENETTVPKETESLTQETLRLNYGEARRFVLNLGETKEVNVGNEMLTILNVQPAGNPNWGDIMEIRIYGGEAGPSSLKIRQGECIHHNPIQLIYLSAKNGGFFDRTYHDPKFEVQVVDIENRGDILCPTPTPYGYDAGK